MLLEVEKLLCGPVKIGKAKAISSVDSRSSGPGGRVSLGSWSGDHRGVNLLSEMEWIRLLP